MVEEQGPREALNFSFWVYISARAADRVTTQRSCSPGSMVASVTPQLITSARIAAFACTPFWHDRGAALGFVISAATHGFIECLWDTGRYGAMCSSRQRWTNSRICSWSVSVSVMHSRG